VNEGVKGPGPFSPSLSPRRHRMAFFVTGAIGVLFFPPFPPHAEELDKEYKNFSIFFFFPFPFRPRVCPLAETFFSFFSPAPLLSPLLLSPVSHEGVEMRRDGPSSSFFSFPCHVRTRATPLHSSMAAFFFPSFRWGAYQGEGRILLFPRRPSQDRSLKFSVTE